MGIVLSTGYSVLSVAALMMSIGCTGKPLSSDSDEPSLLSQIADVKAGKSEQIHLEHIAVGDRELDECAGLEHLHVLLLDHPESRFSASGLEPLATLPELTHLRIRGRDIDDAALAAIAKIQSLQILNVPNATFSDSGLIHLKNLPNLVQLRFGSSQVTDAGMKVIAELPALKRLHLIDVPITGAGLGTLSRMKGLESLYIDGGQFDEAAIESLFRQRPDLHVHLNQRHHDHDPHKHEHP